MTTPPATELLKRVEALGAAIKTGADLLPTQELHAAAEVATRAAGRLRHGTEHTVVALAGATGSGKSSLFNAIVGEEVSPVGVTRPTTNHVRAAVFGGDAPDALLSWLGVRRRHGVGAAGDLAGLVLLDLPDHDSIVADHRLEVDRMVELVDLMVWVLDPQKYADEAVHHRYLSRLAGHTDSMLFVLNQADLVPAADHDRWVAHAAEVLAADGIDEPAILVTSARTGEGLAELGAVLRKRIETRTAALARLNADLRQVASALGPVPTPSPAPGTAMPELSRGLGAAAGSSIVAEAVAAGYRFDAARQTGWPFARWMLRFRRHPFRMLQPPAPPPGAGAPEQPTGIPVDRPRLDLAIRDYADARTADLGPSWTRRAAAVAASRSEELPAALGAAVRTVSHRAVLPPRWWRWIGGVQRALAGAALAGALWLVVLAVLGYLMVPTEDVTPHLGTWPVPTILLLGGAGAGLITAWLSGLAAGAGGRRRARRAARDIEGRITEIASGYVAAPLDAELERWDALSTQLAVAAGEQRTGGVTR